MQLLKTFQKNLKLQLPQPLEQSGEIRYKDFRIKYVFTKDASGKTVLDFLIFEGDVFPPVHRRINKHGEIQDLKKFRFSLYETSEEREEQEIKMKKRNRETAVSIIEKRPGRAR